MTHTYTWDADGNMLSTDGSTVTMMYDAFGRMIEQTRSSGHTEIVYGPYGLKLALMNGQTLVNAFVKLPGGPRAVYGATGLAYYRHSDHLGSSRLATTPSRTKYYDVAYAPYGEDYNGSGTTQDLAFTDENQDTVKGGSSSWSSNLYDFMLREYRTAHGRWTSPDPAGLGAVDPTNPQSWNRYAYVLNNPMAMVDLLGDQCYDSDGNGVAGATSGECWDNGGSSWYDPNTGNWSIPPTTVNVTPGDTCNPGSACYISVTSSIVQEPGNPGPNIDEQVANQNANALAQAVKKTGVQTLNNPCTIGGFYAISAAAGAAGVFGPPAVVAAAENPLTTAHAFLTNLMRQAATAAPGIGIMIRGSIATAKYIYSQCYE